MILSVVFFLSEMTNTVLAERFPAIKCFTCVGYSLEDCKRNGKVMQCRSNEEVCQIEARKRDGRTEMVSDNIDECKGSQIFFSITTYILIHL